MLQRPRVFHRRWLSPRRFSAAFAGGHRHPFLPIHPAKPQRLPRARDRRRRPSSSVELRSASEDEGVRARLHGERVPRAGAGPERCIPGSSEWC